MSLSADAGTFPSSHETCVSFLGLYHVKRKTKTEKIGNLDSSSSKRASEKSGLLHFLCKVSSKNLRPALKTLLSIQQKFKTTLKSR